MTTDEIITKYLRGTSEGREELLAEFPFLKPYEKNPEYLDPETETWLTGMPEGWGEMLLDMFREIKETLIEHHFLDQYQVFQLKEKFGVLRLYDNTELTRDIIRKYEEISMKICHQCGKPATLQTSGWIVYLCDDCFNKIQKKQNTKVDRFIVEVTDGK